MGVIVRIRKYIAVVIFIALLALLRETYAETVWVSDRAAKQFIKVSPEGNKEIIELSNFQNPVVMEVDQRDGSVWLNDITEIFNNQLVKLSAEGNELFRLTGFVLLGDAAVDQKDGSYYAVERMSGEVVKISSDGKELFRINELSPIKDLAGMGCLKNTEGCHDAYKGMGVNLKSIDDIDISPIDSSVWLADTGNKRLLKFSKDGVLITQNDGVGEPQHVAIAIDGSCWVNNIAEKEGRVFKVSEDGTKISAEIKKLDFPFELSVSPIDNTCWVTVKTELLQIAPDGKSILKRIKGFKLLQGISIINPKDGSFWVADYSASEVLKISRDGAILTRVSGFRRPRFLEVYWGKK